MTQSPLMDGLEVEVKNFGPIAKAKFDLRPLTLFIGPSNSGKSYLSILIYALHRALGKEYEHWHHGVKRSRWKFTSEHLNELRGWFDKNFDNSRKAPSTGSNSTSVRENFELPKEISKLICTTLRSDSESGAVAIRYEIERCFGTESFQSLIRRTGSQRTTPSNKTTVALKKSIGSCPDSLKSLAYNLELSAMNSSCSVDISLGMPLHVGSPEYDSNVANLRYTLSKDNLYMSDTTDHKKYMSHVYRRIGASLVNAAFSDLIDPIGRSVHYLPADRTGVMHAHRIIFNAAMKRATRAGIHRLPDMPMLSGVLADFLEQLVGINDPPLLSRRYRPLPPGRRRMHPGSDPRYGLLKKSRQAP